MGERNRSIRNVAWLLAAIVVAIALALAVFRVDRALSITILVDHHAALRAAVDRTPVLAIGAYVALYAGLVAASIPCALVLTAAGGFLFGGAAGAALAVVASTMGAAILYALARTTIGEALARRGSAQLARLREGFRKNAWNYLLSLRLVAVVPFWLVNLAPALFNVPLRTFVTATVVGIIPSSLIIAFAGAAIADMADTQAQTLAVCRASGRTDCIVAFDMATVFTPQILSGLALLAGLGLLPLLLQASGVRRS